MSKNSSPEIKRVIDALKRGNDFGFLGYGPSKKTPRGAHGYCLTSSTAEYLLMNTADDCRKQKEPVDNITSRLPKIKKCVFAKDMKPPKYTDYFFRFINTHGVVYQDSRVKSQIAPDRIKKFLKKIGIGLVAIFFMSRIMLYFVYSA